MSSRFGARFGERTKGLAGYFGRPFVFVGQSGGVGSGTLGAGGEEFRLPVSATLIVSDATGTDQLADGDATMRMMVAVHDYVVRLHLDQIGATRPPQQDDALEDVADGVVYSVDKVLLPGNGWAYCGCSLG